MSGQSEIPMLRILQDVQDVHNWLFQEKHESRCLEMIEPATDLNSLLQDFFSEAKKSDGSEYDIEHLVLLYNSIKAYLSTRHYSAKLTDPVFEGTNAALEARGGGGKSRIKLKKLSPDVEESLWTKDHFGAHDGEALNTTLVYYFTKFFELGTKTEHKELCFGDVVLRCGEGNIRYLEFDPRLTRGNCDDSLSHLSPKLGVNEYETFEPKLVFQGGPPQKDPVLLFESFIQHRPFRTRRPRSPMYLQPVLIHSSTAREWYEDKPLSTKSLNRIIRCISRGGKVSRKRIERKQASNCSPTQPPLQIDPVENEAKQETEIVSVEESEQDSTQVDCVSVDGGYNDQEYGYDDEVNSIMNSSSGPLVPAGRSSNTDLNNLSPGSRLEFRGNFGQDSSDYGRGSDRDYAPNNTGSDLPFNLLDVLRDDLSSLRSSRDPVRTMSPLLQPSYPLDTGLGDFGSGYAPRSYGQEPPSRLSGRSRLQGRLQALRTGPPEPRQARDTWRYRGGEDTRNRTTAYQPRSTRWSSQEDLSYNDGVYDGYPASRAAIGYREGTVADRYSPELSLQGTRDDYVHNTQRRINERIASRTESPSRMDVTERPERARPDRTRGRRYMTQPIDFNYSSYSSGSDLSSSSQRQPSTISYARQALQRAEEREATSSQPRKVISPPPGRPEPTPMTEGQGETEEAELETEQQKEQRKTIRAKMLAGNIPQGPKSPAAKKKLILDETKLEEMFLKCLICGDIFNHTDRSPKLLPCHHTFCLACLLEMFRVEIEQRQAMVSIYQNRVPMAVRIGCPTCRDSKIISQDELKKMANDRTVLSLLDLVVHSESCVVNYCSRHQTQPLNFFCETCIQPVCCDCTVLDHMQSDNHVVMNIEGALSKYKPMIEECLTKLSNHASELMESKTILEGAIHTLDTNRNEVVTKLKETFQQFRTAADDREEELVEISQREIGKKKDDLTKCLDLVLKRRNILQSNKSAVKDAQQEEHCERLFTAHNKLKEILEDKLSVPEKLLDNDFAATLNFDDTEQTNVIFKLSEFGEVIFERI